MTVILTRLFHFLAGLFCKVVTRPRLINPKYLVSERAEQKVYFVLESNRLSHRLILKNLLQKQLRTLSEDQILFADSGGVAPLREALTDLISTQQSNPNIEINLVPVAIFHGRMPEREDSWLNLLYAETWHKAGALGGILQLLINGRATLIKIDPPVSLPKLITPEESQAEIARKTARVLRTHFVITRRSIIGPDLSHRRTMISLVLNHPDVQTAIDQQAQTSGESRHRIERHCLKTLDKIAANFSPVFVRLLSPVLGWTWNRLYQRVNVHNIEPVREYAKDHQLIYIPCHRSHMDYLLLSWALYQHGLAMPHVAAGDNLNIPLLGSMLKRCGAIFMRRSFKGDPLYSSLYKIYLQQMFHRGHPLEYFIEGGRSRTGRLLPAKTGLLSMTLDLYRTDPDRPVALIPVWIGHDRLVESHSYQDQLSGGNKRPESIKQLLTSLRLLKQSFGETFLSFGDPIALQQRSAIDTPLEEEVNKIADLVMNRINHAACLSSSSILATVLLAGFQKQSVAEINNKCSSLLQLLTKLNSDKDCLPAGKVTEWIEQADRMNQLELAQNQVSLSVEQSNEMTFYRNNIQHLVLLPGLYLLLVHRQEAVKAQQINKTIRALYPFIQSELFLPWPEEKLTDVLRSVRETLIDENLLSGDAQSGWKLTANPLCSTLLLTVEPIILRYYIVLKALTRYQEIGHEDLTDTSRKIAQKIHSEYGYSPPEYQDKHVLQVFIDQLIQHQMIESDGSRLISNLETGEILSQIEKVLRPHMISLIDSQLEH